jgi:predicted glycosyltransferase
MTARRSALFYVQHLLGIGHLQRTLAIAAAAAEAGIDATVVSGGPAPSAPPSVRLIQLPPVRARDATFATLVDEHGRDVDAAFEARRRDELIAAFDAVAPDILVTELFPFGRRMLRFELMPLLERAAARTPRPRIVSSVRDILVPGTPEKAADMAATARRWYDAVLVHGDPAVVRFEETFPRAGEIADLIRYTGYVAPPRPTQANAREGVVVSAGGSAVGLTLLATAIAARPLSRMKTAPWRILVGHGVPESDFAILRAVARSGVTVERVRPDFRALLGAAALSISQAGYNTVMDVVACGPRAIFVPFYEERQSEQALRAARFAERFGYRHLAEAELEPAILAAAIDRAMKTEPRTATVDLNGGPASAAALLALMQTSAPA